MVKKNRLLKETAVVKFLDDGEFEVTSHNTDLTPELGETK